MTKTKAKAYITQVCERQPGARYVTTLCGASSTCSDVDDLRGFIEAGYDSWAVAICVDCLDVIARRETDRIRDKGRADERAGLPNYFSGTPSQIQAYLDGRRDIRLRRRLYTHHYINVYCTAADLAAWKDKAKAEDRTLSAWARRVLNAAKRGDANV